MDAALRISVEAALGEAIVSADSLSGGCINLAYVCRLRSGESVFIKSKPGCDARMFEAEASGLAWLGAAKALRIPTILHVDQTFLALEFIEAGAPTEDYEELLGSGLAHLHVFGASEFGFPVAGFLATLPQDNRPTADWPSFYSERRLRPLVQEAVDKSVVPPSWVDKFETLFAKLPELVGDPEPPARLHGDLWSGNVYCDRAGHPVLIDPAVYGGHREVDLAMLELFGNPSERFYRAYHEHYPLQIGYKERRALYQLYPLLAHILLFGSAYNAQCLRALDSYV